MRLQCYNLSATCCFDLNRRCTKKFWSSLQHLMTTSITHPETPSFLTMSNGLHSLQAATADLP